jgi:hypothetical protein
MVNPVLVVEEHALVITGQGNLVPEAHVARQHYSTAANGKVVPSHAGSPLARQSCVEEPLLNVRGSSVDLQAHPGSLVASRDQHLRVQTGCQPDQGTHGGHVAQRLEGLRATRDPL